MSDEVYDIRLVCLSLLIALLTSYTGLKLSRRISFSQGRLGWLWLATSACVLGGGIWVLHMLAMMAYRAPTAIRYDLTLSFCSLIVIIGGIGLGFLAAQLRGPAWRGSILGGLCICVSTAVMHFMGMAAMEMNGYIVYNKHLIAVSAVLSAWAMSVALFLSRRDRSSFGTISAAACMAAGVGGLHYTAMYAASIICSSPSEPHASTTVQQKGLFLLVNAVTFSVLGLTLIAAAMDRRRAAQEARIWKAGEARFQSLYRLSPMPLHSVDFDGNVIEVSDYWLQLMGYERSDVVGRPMSAFMTEGSALIYSANRDSLMKIGAIRDSALQFRCRDGAILDVLLSEYIERDDAGQFLRANGGLVDITARKQAEEAARQAQKMEAVGQLTGGIAHDFNNLLSAILGSLELATKRVEDARVLRLLDTAQQAALRGARLTSHMLAFSRRQDIAVQAVDTRQVVSGLSDLLQRLIGPLMRVEFDLAPDTWSSVADPVQLEVSLVNLAVNARDAMPFGGVLRFQTQNIKNAPGLPPGDYVAIAVSDTGDGMPEDVRQNAFQPFFTTKGAGKGTGLGLAMVLGFASKAGGTVTIESAPKMGTTVTIYLPRTEAETVDEAVDVPEGALKPMRVLLVDDDRAVRVAVRDMLKECGHEAIDAASGSEALALLAEHPFDLLITDYAMPQMTGMQLAREAQASQPDLPVLIITGYVEADLLRVWRGENRGTLPKPFQTRELQAALFRLLDKAPKQTEAEDTFKAS